MVELYVFVQRIYRLIFLCICELLKPRHVDRALWRPQFCKEFWFVKSYKNVSAEDSWVFLVLNPMNAWRNCFKMMSLIASLEKVRLQFNFSCSGSVLSSNTVKLYLVTVLCLDVSVLSCNVLVTHTFFFFFNTYLEVQLDVYCIQYMCRIHVICHKSLCWCSNFQP